MLIRSCLFIFILATLVSCHSSTTKEHINPEKKGPIEGTWKLITATIIEKGDTTVTDYTLNRSFIKIINPTHFAFLHHDLHRGADSPAVFSSGGGRYTFKDNMYTEYLEYCSAREWEGHTFQFQLSFANDTLIQQGVEKIENLGVERINKETYIRVHQQ